eukprot:scaffold9334_cov122-Isochrysis_galbana.AAC.8
MSQGGWRLDQGRAQGGVWSHLGGRAGAGGGRVRGKGAWRVPEMGMGGRGRTRSRPRGRVVVVGTRVRWGACRARGSFCIFEMGSRSGVGITLERFGEGEGGEGLACTALAKAIWSAEHRRVGGRRRGLPST